MKTTGQTAISWPNRDSLPRMANVASMGRGDTYPPQTARRIGCAGSPKEKPFATAKLLMTFVRSRLRRPCLQLGKCQFAHGLGKLTLRKYDLLELCLTRRIRLRSGS